MIGDKSLHRLLWERAYTPARLRDTLCVKHPVFSPWAAHLLRYGKTFLLSDNSLFLLRLCFFFLRILLTGSYKLSAILSCAHSCDTFINASPMNIPIICITYEHYCYMHLLWAFLLYDHSVTDTCNIVICWSSYFMTYFLPLPSVFKRRYNLLTIL